MLLWTVSRSQQRQHQEIQRSNQVLCLSNYKVNISHHHLMAAITQQKGQKDAVRHTNMSNYCWDKGRTECCRGCSMQNMPAACRVLTTMIMVLILVRLIIIQPAVLRDQQQMLEGLNKWPSKSTLVHFLVSVKQCRWHLQLLTAGMKSLWSVAPPHRLFVWQYLSNCIPCPQQP